MNTLMRSARHLVLTTMLLLGMAVVLPGAASAAPQGNSGAAHACQQGGYTSLVGIADGAITTFATTGQCVSYAANGGHLVSASVVQPCLDGGYAHLAPTENPTAPFTSQEACTSYTAGGGTAVPVVPSITVTMTPTSNPNYCFPNVTLNNFAPGTYGLTSTIAAPGFDDDVYTSTVTTDENGNAGPNTPIGSYYQGPGYTFTATVDDITSGPVPLACS